MTPIKNTPSYIFLSTVLSQKKSFSLRDISNELEKKGMKIEEGKIKKALNSLCDNWIITEEDCKYRNYIKKPLVIR